MKPKDLAHIQIPESLSLSPDGRAVVFSLKTIDLERDMYLSRLWRVPADGSAPPVQLTRGDRDFTPRISPDGRWIAFVRAATEDSKPQLHLMPFDGGEPWEVTNGKQHPLGIEEPMWSPDSSTIAYIARVPEQGRYGTVEKRGPEKEPPRRITGFDYRMDGIGYLGDRYHHIFTINPLTTSTSAEPKRHTEGDFGHGRAAWSPDGRSLTFASARHDDRHRSIVNDIFVIDVENGELRQLTETRLSCEQPLFSRDGSLIYFSGRERGESGMDFFAQHTGAYAIAADGSGQATRLSDAEKYNLDTMLGLGRQGVLFTNQNRGAVELLEFNVDGGGEPRPLLTGNRQVSAFDTAGGTIAAAVADPACSGEIVVIDAFGERTLTSYGKQWAQASTVHAMEEVTAAAPDGHPVHGWVVKPAGDGPHPVLLMIHGGPFTQYGWRLFDEAQVYADAGYAVVYGNPRGSSGYGQAHGRYVMGEVGPRSATDLYALLDQALADPTLDANRVGMLGGSHGGFMVSWIAGHTNRFRAAVSERAVNAIDSFTGTSDIGWFFPSLYGEPETHHEQSPLTYAGNVSTPMLIIHSENDYRCPLEQAQRYFQALASRGAEVEMLLFPGEGHEMSRSGLPSHRLARFEAILEWFDRHMKD